MMDESYPALLLSQPVFWGRVRGVGIPVSDICFPVSKLRSIYRHYEGAIASFLCICKSHEHGQLLPVVFKQLLT